MTHPPSSASTRNLVLGRIRDSLGERGEAAGAAYDRIRRDYVGAGTLDPGAILDLLADRLHHYQVDVYRCEPATVMKTIATALATRGRLRMVVPADLDPAWLPGGIEFIRDEGLSFSALDVSDGVMTGCSLAIASTGTIVLRHTAGEGRRALTLIPDYHLCVVRSSQVVQTVPVAMRQLAALAPALLTTISGPSATADIEMTRIRGVHGPRTLDVVIVIE
jgi:L-lactate dehydrogenase complex protein LldG